MAGNVQRIRFWLFAAAAAVGIAAFTFATGVVVTDWLERDNAFCVSCHLTETRRLHAEKFSGFQSIDGAARTLAAAHALSRAGEFKCVDCHNGAGLRDKLAIKAQAARDTLAYLFGSFEEPTQMRFPLGNRVCLQCHDLRDASNKAATKFHDDPYHRDLPFVCFECHTVHLEGPRNTRFLRAESVQPLCDQCHSSMQ